MDEWMDGYVYGWMDGWLCLWMDGRMKCSYFPTFLLQTTAVGCESAEVSSIHGSTATEP